MNPFTDATGLAIQLRGQRGTHLVVLYSHLPHADGANEHGGLCVPNLDLRKNCMTCIYKYISELVFLYTFHKTQNIVSLHVLLAKLCSFDLGLPHSGVSNAGSHPVQPSAERAQKSFGKTTSRLRLLPR